MLRTLRWAGLTALLLSSVPQTESDAARVQLEYAAGPRQEAPLEALAERLAADPAPLVVRFSGAGRAQDPAPAGPAGAPEEAGREDRVEVELTGSERLVGRIGGGSGETLVLQLTGDTLLPLEIDALLAVRFPGRLPTDPGAGVERAPEGDRLYRRVGERLDRIDGLLEGFEPAGVRFESLVGRQLVPWEELAALFIEPLGGAPEASPADGAMVLDLIDGTRLEARLLSSSAQELVFEVRGGARLELRPDVLSRLSAGPDRLAYLSERVPDEVSGGSAFGDQFGLVFRPNVDHAVHGGPLLAGGRRHPRGIGVQAPTALRYALAPEAGDPSGGWRALRGAVALDASVLKLGLEGSARFRVLLDGALAWESARLTAGSGLIELPEIALEGARKLVLDVSMEDGLNTGDRADWIDLRLVR